MEANFEMILIRLHDHKTSKSDSEKDVLFINIVGCLTIAIIVQVNFNKSLGILTEARKHAKDHCFLLQSRCPHLKYGYKNLVK